VPKMCLQKKTKDNNIIIYYVLKNNDLHLKTNANYYYRVQGALHMHREIIVIFVFGLKKINSISSFFIHFKIIFIIIIIFTNIGIFI
jgi:hypothetical protein